MTENEVKVITYTKKHAEIIKNGIGSISEVLNGTDVEEKRSLLFCLDKYLDPYYGYNLPNSDEIFLLLQQQLFLSDSKEIKEDIIQLLADYAEKPLDYLADKVNLLEIEPELLTEALYALGNTYNEKYVPVFIQYENHHIPSVRGAAKEVLTRLAYEQKPNK